MECLHFRLRRACRAHRQSLRADVSAAGGGCGGRDRCGAATGRHNGGKSAAARGGIECEMKGSISRAKTLSRAPRLNGSSSSAVGEVTEADADEERVEPRVLVFDAGVRNVAVPSVDRQRV